MKRKYLVEMPLELPDRWFQVCCCDSWDAAGEVVCILLRNTQNVGIILRIVVVDV